MAGDTVITIVGNLTADPELRFTPSGAAVANFTVASTPRTFDRQSNEWKDGETLFMRCSVWRDAAENVAESLAPRHPGHRHRPAQESGPTRPRKARSAPSSRWTSTRSAPRCATRRPRWRAPSVGRAPVAASAARAARADKPAGMPGRSPTRGRPVPPVAVTARKAATAKADRVARAVTVAMGDRRRAAPPRVVGAAARRPTTSPRSDRPDRRQHTFTTDV
jgi:hypothetical protein